MPTSAAHVPFNGSTTRCMQGCGDGLSPVIPRKRNIGLRANTGEWTMDTAGASNLQTGRSLWHATTTPHTSAM